MSSSLQHFWQLASSSTEDRLRSAGGLINSLALSKAVEPSNVVVPGPSRIFDDGLIGDVRDEEVQQAEDALQQCGSTDLVYTIKRLIKGLASHRESARLGFSVALCELLSRLSSISTYHITTLILAYSSPMGKIKGQEERDMYFARLFGLYALVRSQMLTNDAVSAEADARRIVGILWAMANKKSWLMESVARITVDLVQSLSTSNVSWRDALSKWILERVCEEKTVTVDHVAVFMALQEYMPNAFATKAQRLPHFASQEILTTANMSVLAKLVKDARLQDGQAESMPEVNSTSSAGSMQPHFVWEMILNAYAGTKDPKRLPFADTFRILVDENLFAATSSHQKKAWGFTIWTRSLAILPDHLIAQVFTQNLMRTLMNQLGGKDRVLHKIAQKACVDVQETVKERPEITLLVIKQFTGPFGNVKFDQLTNTKTIETLLRYLNEEEVRQHVDDVVHALYVTEASGTQIALLDQLLVIARNPSVRTGDECIENILTLFAGHGLYTVKKAITNADGSHSCLDRLPTTPFTPAVKAVCRSHFLSCLGDLHAAEIGTGDAVDWVARAEKMMQWLEGKSKHLEEMNVRSWECIGTAKKAVERLRKRHASAKIDSEAKRKEHALTSLLSMEIFYVIIQQSDEEEAQALLNPMLECVERLILNPGQNVEVDDQPGAMELLIDCVSNALQPTSAFLRSVATDAFDRYADQLTQSGMQLLLEQLGFNQDGENSMDEETTEEEAKGTDGDSESDTSATSSPSEVDEDDEMDDEDVDADFAAKVRHALQSGTKPAEDEDDEETNDGAGYGSDLGDDEMLLIDDKLAEVFREKFSTRKKEDEAKKEEIAFHIRIVDLLDHFAKKHGDSPLCIDLVLPLFTIALEKDKALDPLRQRASKVLQKTSSRVKDAPVQSDISQIVKSLDAIQKMAATNLTANQQSLASGANLFLTRSGLQEKSEVPHAIRQTYLDTLVDFMERKSNNLKPAFLIDAFQRFPRLGFSLRKELAEFAFKPKSTAQQAFRQAQALEMLRSCLGQIIAQASVYNDVSIDEVTESLQEVARRTLELVQQDGQKVKDLLKIALQFARLSKRWVENEGRGGESASLDAIWNAAQMDKAMATISQSGGGSQVNLMKQLVVLTRSSERAAAVKQKRPAAASSQPTKKTKTTKTKE